MNQILCQIEGQKAEQFELLTSIEVQLVTNQFVFDLILNCAAFEAKDFGAVEFIELEEVEKNID